MLFKYPQLLWSLWLLLIPILVHLLQLRRFKTTPFTNVRLLKKVQAKSQKSQSLKKWLLLLSRMALFACLVLAFAQPFTANKTAFKKQELAIYLDNSFSMQARLQQGSLLEEAIQDLINSIPEDTHFSLFTNDSEFRDVTMEEIRNSLLQMGHSTGQLSLSEIELKGNSYFSEDTDALRRLLILSDLQSSMGQNYTPGNPNNELFFVPLRAEDVSNVSIDTLFLQTTSGTENNLLVRVSGNKDFGSIPVSLFNKGNLIAKSAVSYESDRPSDLILTLPEGEIEGEVSLSDTGLAYDNTLYFNIDSREKIRVLGIGNSGGFLSRLFGDDTTEYSTVAAVEQAASLLPEQDLVILNELLSLTSGESEALREFVDLGGSLLIIPSLEMDTRDFNQFLAPFGLTFNKKNPFPLEITDINYAHPLYRDVFESEVENFQYPMVAEYFTLGGRIEKILSYSNEDPFLGSRGKIYVFSTSMDPVNSNFTSSPLVVPTLYAMAVRSRSLPTPYYLLGTSQSVDVPVQLGEDRILGLKKGEMEFIPRQQAVGRKTRMWFDETPTEAGIYSLENSPLERSLSFNDPRNESDLTYLDLKSIGDGIEVAASIPELFEGFEKDNAVTGLWKWFVILAVLFLLAEVIIQKVLK